ncbi:MAG: hypothetical protein ACLU38_15695 [Dysosmobacter sp.]
MDLQAQKMVLRRRPYGRAIHQRAIYQRDRRDTAKALEKLGITTLRDLISYFPRSYEDRTLTRPIRDLTEGENVCVRAMIAADPTAHRIPGGRAIVRTRAVDETEECWTLCSSIRSTGKTASTGGRSTSSTARWRASAVTGW